MAERKYIAKVKCYGFRARSWKQGEVMFADPEKEKVPEAHFDMVGGNKKQATKEPPKPKDPPKDGDDNTSDSNPKQ